MVADAERNGGPGSEGEAGSGCGAGGLHKKKACRRCCREGGHGRASPAEARQRRRSAEKTWQGCSGVGWVRSPAVHTPSPSVKKNTTCKQR